MPNRKVQNVKKTCQKYFHKFANYTKNQKIFSIFLIIFSIVLFCFPIAKVTTIDPYGKELFWFIGKTFFPTMIVVFSSMLFLLWCNMNTRFKWFVVNFLGFRESEPMLNFLFLWVIASAFMWILDTLRMLWSVTQSASLTLWGYLMLILLLIWIIISFIEVRKWANKNSQRTKILNIVDDEAPQKKSDEKTIQHLFDVDDEDFE